MNIPVRFCFLATAVGVVLAPDLHVVLVRKFLDVEFIEHACNVFHFHLLQRIFSRLLSEEMAMKCMLKFCLSDLTRISASIFEVVSVV
jgi:hypothetical protein